MNSTEARVIDAKLEHMSKDLARMSGAVDGVNAGMQTLGRVEQAQQHMLDMLKDGATRMGDHEARIQTIEREMPGLRELRRYVIAGVLAGVGMIGVALVKLVIVDLPRVQAPAPVLAPPPNYQQKGTNA